MVMPLLVLALLAAPALADEEPAPETARVVQVELKSNVREDPAPENPFGPVPRNFRRTLELLDRIAADEDVAGVRLVVDEVPDLARGLELMDALRGVQRAGKRVVCYAETLRQGQLAFATLADHLAVPPSGLIALEGLTAELMYLKDMFAKVDVRFEVLHVGDFKTAYEDFARESMSDAQRKMLGDILDAAYERLLGVIAGNRGLERSEVEALFERVLVPPPAAARAGLIDAVAYEDEFEAKLEEMFGKPIEFVDDYGEKKVDLEKMLANPFAMLGNLEELFGAKKKKKPEEPHVAVVYATGQIVSGKSTADFSGNVSAMGSETMVKALEEVYEDENCRAVVLRVNSPGGSAIASDMIWRAIERVRTRKPVVASMGRVAASGGYWISMSCDAILAQPNTLTGSIGVVALVPDVSQAIADLGINVEVVSRGPHGDDLALLANGPTELLKNTITRSMERVYATFVEKVSRGRRLDPEAVHALAKGRVWTGEQALDNGLVDELGGLQDAIAMACVLSGADLQPGSVPIAEYPAPPNVLEALEEAFGVAASARARPAALALAERLGFGDLVALVERQLADTDPLSPERVQCILPFALRIR